MRTKLIALVGISLAAGACSARPPGLSGVYTALPPATAPAKEAIRAVAPPVRVAESPRLPAVARPASPPVVAQYTPPDVMPGDLLEAIPERREGFNPVAVLAASSLARSHWESLRPTQLTRAPLLLNSSIMTGALDETGPRARPRIRDYDRAATMDKLLDGGRAAVRPICENC